MRHDLLADASRESPVMQRPSIMMIQGPQLRATALQTSSASQHYCLMSSYQISMQKDIHLDSSVSVRCSSFTQSYTQPRLQRAAALAATRTVQTWSTHAKRPGHVNSTISFQRRQSVKIINKLCPMPFARLDSYSTAFATMFLKYASSWLTLQSYHAVISKSSPCDAAPCTLS